MKSLLWLFYCRFRWITLVDDRYQRASLIALVGQKFRCNRVLGTCFSCTLCCKQRSILYRKADENGQFYIVLYLSFMWRCICFFRRVSWAYALKQTLHLYFKASNDFGCNRSGCGTLLASKAPCFFIMCWLSCDCCLNDLPGHSEQEKLRMPLCTSKCWFNEVTWVNFFGHWLQTYSWILWCVFIWLLRLVTC